jgi:catechol 2,3-dioxygenase-like lactoylglutathione lyase family enzyme
MTVSGLDHVNIDTDRPDETIAFYCTVLGLENRPDERPTFSTPGAWLWTGDRAVVHLNFHESFPEDLDEGARHRPSTGAFNHVAFEAGDYDEICATLESNGIGYDVSHRPDIELRQIFVRDPNGIRIELNIRGPFDPA